MSTRRLYVILFVLLFNVTVISYLLLRDVLSGLQVAEVFLFLPPDSVHVSLQLFIVFS